MDVVSQCRLRVGSLLFRPSAETWSLTVVCKATFVLRPDESPLAAEQEPLTEVDDHWDDDPQKSLHFATDLVPYKRRPEIVVAGHVYAPPGTKVPSLTAAIGVDDFTKAVTVHGDRTFAPDGTLSEPTPFSRIPLRWERAAAGIATNPAGVRMGAGAPTDASGRLHAPNLTPPGVVLTRREHIVQAAGFGPISPLWPQRTVFLRALGADWDPERWAERPLPKGFDPGYFNAAPPDQQLPRLTGDERLALTALHREHPVLVTRLAKIAPRAVGTFPGSAPFEVPLVRDTLTIDTDRGIATVVLRGHVALDRPSREGWVVITMEEPAASAPHVASSLEQDGAHLGSAGIDLAIIDDESTYSQETGPHAARAEDPDDGETQRVVLPFRKSLTEIEPPPAAPPHEPAPVGSLPFRRVSGAIVGGSALGRSMRLTPPEAEVPVVAIPVAPAPVAPAQVVPVPALLAPIAPIAPIAPPLVAEPPPPIESPPVFVPAPTPDGEEPPPPPMLGPLAPIAPSISAPPSEPPAPAAPVAEAPRAPADPANEPLPLSEFPLERCATLDAWLALHPEKEADRLSREDLSPPVWKRLLAHWAAALRDESRRGKVTQLRAYDAAYVTELERVRGPLTPADYAKILVAAERGTTDALLAELTLPRTALLRVQRVWIARMTRDTSVEEAVRAAVESARAA